MKSWKKSSAYLSIIPIKYFFREKKDQENELLQEICEFTGRSLNASACSIFLVEKNKKVARQIAGDGYQREFIGKAVFEIVSQDAVVEAPKSENEKLGITGWILSTGKPLLIRDSASLYDHPHHLGRYSTSTSDNKSEQCIQSFIGVPIWGINQNLVGIIKAERETKNNSEGFSENDEGSLIKIAEGIGHCLNYYKLSKNKEKVWDVIKAWTLYVLTIASSEEHDLSSFIQSMVELLCEISHAESCSLFLLDSEKAFLTQYAGCGYQINGNMIRSYKMPELNNGLHEGLTTFIVSSKECFYAKTHDDLIKHPHWGHKFDDQNFQKKDIYCEALLGIPLIPGVEAIGVIKFENSNSNQFNTKDPFPLEMQRVLNLLSQYFSIAILRLQSQASKRWDLIEKATKPINDFLLISGERETKVKAAISEFKNALNAECCAIFIKEGNRLIQYEWSAVGYATNVTEGGNREYEFVEHKKIVDNPTSNNERIGLTVWIASTGNKFIAKSHDDLKNHPHWLHKYDNENFSHGDRCDSLLGLPLKSNDEILGVIKVENKQDIHGNRIAFTKEDELIFDLFVSSLANYLYYLEKSPQKNLKDFIESQNENSHEIWALGLVYQLEGLQGFNIELPPLPNNSVVVKTLSLGICGTDIQSFGSKDPGKYTLIEFHEALGKVAWTGQNTDSQYIEKGDIVVPIVRRCQTWDSPVEPGGEDPSIVKYTFDSCKESFRCQNYRRPDICYFGEYPKNNSNNQKIGYRSRGTGKCHGFGSKFFIDTTEWLVLACKSSEIENIPNITLGRLILTEPLAVVWKMKRELEQVRPIRPFQDKVLILGLGPIGYLATLLISTMYPSIECFVVDRFTEDKKWITEIRKIPKVEYYKIQNNSSWHKELNNKNFDIIIEATGNPQKVIEKAIEVIAPNGALALLSVINSSSAYLKKISPTILSAIVRKNVKIIGSVNESRSDFENAIKFIKTFHFDKESILDSLIHNLTIDPGTWEVIKEVKKIKGKKVKTRITAPKIILNAEN